MAAASPSSCIFCQIGRSSTTTTLLHTDDKVVAFRDINPSAFRQLGCLSARKASLE
ncbi:putative sulfate adenylyltransferase (ADP) [Helianthus annuus]|uniref:Putative HIT-like domain-containing protein n=1 Tax=Helianthus annuus TaxID=4232 RepID=A0A251RPK8_HELAN|nr:putative sulfate adenylyltransferase (ADP) [Helianthus annuus]KAJ0812994.1 putative sulfate adenylyltransferase (ADP) [Helianthus annuus]KAJ0826116.1 putative sulfate adenylyltransferase (ADP) [Helianthus annuus]